jgi:FHA domain-containing protein
VAAWAINKDVQATSASPSLAAVEHGRVEVSIPPPVQPSPPAQTTAPSSAHSGAVDAHALWRAFCTGADIQLKLPDGVSPELMHVIGQLMRNSIEGTLKMMAVRALTRQELRADVTMFQAQNNNPLKFSPDAQAALESLLQPPARGFMQGPAAVTDAMHDLVGHAIGTMAGTRAALEGVLQRFAPTVLEGKLGGNTMRDAFVPMVRRSRLWELYLQHFEAIRMEAQEDFHTLFGRAFLAAYEQQLDELYEQQRQRRTASRAKAATDQP